MSRPASTPTGEASARPQHSWRFGHGQTNRQEWAEVDRAKLEGRAEEYLVAQAVARAHDAPVKVGGELYKRLTAQADPPPKTKRARKAAAPPRSDPGPGPCPCDNATDATEMRAQLAAHARAEMEPVRVVLRGLHGAAPDVRKLAEDVALCVGLRLADEDGRPMPYSCRFAQERTGIDYKRASRILLALVKRGTLTAEAPMPGTRTAVYGIPGYTEPERTSDRMPVAGGEPGPIPVEAQDIGAPRTAVEPAPEAVDEPSVRDAERRGPTGALDWPPAAEGSAERGDGRAVMGHAGERYARCPTVAALLARALEGPASALGGTVRDDALWLACQLRDNGHEEHGAAYEALLDFASRQPARFTAGEAVRILRHAYGRPPRPPWGSPTGRTCGEIER